MIDRMLTIKEVADRLRVTERSVFRYMADGRLKGYKPARKWLITEENLKAFIEGEPTTRR